MPVVVTTKPRDRTRRSSQRKHCLRNRRRNKNKNNQHFRWHNLRHSLATFFGSNEVHPSVIQTMLRHTQQQTTARYIHAVNAKQIEAQGKYLEAIKVVAKQPDRAA